MPDPRPAFSIAPWLSVRDSRRAIAYYKEAFGVTEVHHAENAAGDAVSHLVMDGADFWVSDDPATRTGGAEAVGAGTIRMILTVPDPDAAFARAIAAGGTVVFPVGEGHGWRLGRLVDPFGLHWEIGRPLSGRC
jgi:PhnB protein